MLEQLRNPPKGNLYDNNGAQNKGWKLVGYSLKIETLLQNVHWLPHWKFTVNLSYQIEVLSHNTKVGRNDLQQAIILSFAMTNIANMHV